MTQKGSASLDRADGYHLQAIHLDEKRAIRTNGVFTVIAVRDGSGLSAKLEVGQKRRSGTWS